jgi:hypothetical protein
VTTAAEGSPIITAPRERGWRWLVLALAAAVAVSMVQQWPASLALPALLVQWLLPVERFLLLVLCGLGACAVASWVRGGRALPAVAAMLGLALFVWREAPVSTGLTSFEYGWSVLVAAMFGWVCLASVNGALLHRALVAVALSGFVVLLISSFTADETGSVLGSLDAGFTQELMNRRDRALSVWQGRVTDPAWQALGARIPAIPETVNRVAQRLEQASPPVALVPALLVLETLAALALAWTTWHRLTRVRLGPPLATLTQFRFSDQLVWGLVVGATMMLVPTLEGWWVAGVNLLVVFGALHALRGVGVLVWWIPDRWAVVPLLVLVLCIPLLGPVPVLATVAVLALGLGLGDTWRDFRRTARPLRSNPRP